MLLLLAASAVVFASRASFLPPTLEDVDSVNFALALEHFDPALHQPHPPGYPVYIALGRLVHLAVPDPAKALGLLSALAQTALVVPLFFLFRRLSSTPGRAALSTLLVFACPILWFNGARPMSDSVGLLFVVSTQALLLHALDTGRMLGAASLLVGLSLGVRLQTCFLTGPLWLWTLFRRRTFRSGFEAFAVGATIWALPMVIATGGLDEYARAFAHTMGDAVESEPLMVGLTLNRAARALHDVAIAPWASPGLGLLMTALAALGFSVRAARRSPALGLACLAFLPYLAVHALLQQVSTVRYTLPYVPLIAWLAIEGIGSLAERFRTPRFLEGAASGALAVFCAALTIPALALYHLTTSPPYAAMAAIERQAASGPDFVLAGHYMFWRYFPVRPDRVDLLRARPGEAIPRLVDHLLTGDEREILFLANPRRTDLVSFSRESRRLLERWEWPQSIRPFLSGARPNEVELFSIRSPLFFASAGWLLSLDSGGRDERPPDPVRVAYLKPLDGPAFLLVGGGPTSGLTDCRLEIVIPEILADRAPCGQELLRGYDLAGGRAGKDYRRLSVTTSRGDQPISAPFVLDGLDYGPADAPGFVQGEGWFNPEKDEDLRRFRWTSDRARSLLHIPGGGARLSIEGSVPLKYLGPDLGIALLENGVTLAKTRVLDAHGRFRLEVEITGERAFHNVELTAERSFVPDDLQKNGDRRQLALRVYSFDLNALRPSP